MAILFASDWARYRDPIVDTKTKNQSFLILADKYRQMGVKNYYFLLALIDRRLQGIDPFDPNLPVEVRMAIRMECQENIWYFLREVARLPPIASSEPVPYIANRGNIALTWLYLNHVTGLLVQPRQTGKSGSVDTLTDWLINIGTRHSKMLMITKDSTLQVDTIDRIKAMREYLPGYIYTRDPKDMDNKTGLNNTFLDNEYKTGVGRSNVPAANNLGRGITVPNVHFDEVPFITHIAVTMPAALKAGNFARRAAEKNGAPWGTILTTTAGRRDDRDGGWVYNEIVSKAFPWTETLFDCTDRKNLNLVIDRGCTGRMQVVDITMSHRQLGYTDEWLYNSIRESGGSREDIERDLLNIWNSGSARSPLSAELNERIRRSERDPAWVEMFDQGFSVRWYIDRDKMDWAKEHARYVMGLDTSEGVGRDAIAGVILDVTDLSVVGVTTVKLSNIIEFGHWLAQFLIAHPEICLIPERKSTGQTIIDILLLLLPPAGVDPFKRIFNSIVEEAHTSEKAQQAFYLINRDMGSRDEFFYTERKATFGFMTTASKRDFLYGNTLQQAAAQGGDRFHDHRLIQEVTSLSVRNNRIDHLTSGHDDHCFSLLLAQWFIHMATNLAHYGIEPGVAMCGLSDKELDGRTPMERVKDQRQEDIKEEIELLIATLAECDNPALASLYERKLQMLSRRLEARGVDQAFSLDAVMERVRKERQTKQRRSTTVLADPAAKEMADLQSTVDAFKRGLFQRSRY